MADNDPGSDVEDGECSSSPKNNIPEIIDLTESADDESFVLDRTNDALNSYDSSIEELEDNESNGNWKKQIHASVLSLEEIEGKEMTKKNTRSKMTCFNCGCDHSIRDCPEPKDLQRIRKNRDAFNDNRSNKDTRYHDPSESSSTPQFKPGRISEALQRALGLGPNDIPEYVYRMRKMGFFKGYPPGYLKQAITKQAVNDLLDFHSDTPELKRDEKEDMNERAPSPTLNPEKILYYFGFNKTYRALRDKERFTVPPFEDFVRYLEKDVKKRFKEDESTRREEVKASRKRKIREANEVEAKRTKGEADTQVEENTVIDILESDKEREEEVTPAASDIISPSTPTSNTSLNGRKLSLGTPVSGQRSGGAIKKPSLDAFAVGIVPFASIRHGGVDPQIVEAPTPRTGFLRKVMRKIKETLT